MFSKIFQFYLKTDQRKNKPKKFLFKPISFFFKKTPPTLQSGASILQKISNYFQLNKKPARSELSK